jgi:hypothetical protein
MPQIDPPAFSECVTKFPGIPESVGVREIAERLAKISGYACPNDSER